MNSSAISRRHLCGFASMLLAAVALEACGSVTPSQAATDAGLIASGLASAVAALSAMPGIPADKLALVQTALADIKAASASLASSTAGVDATTVKGIATLVTQIAVTVLPFVPGGAPIAAVIAAAQSLVPVLLAAAGIAGAATAAARFSPAEARALLKAGV